MTEHLYPPAGGPWQISEGLRDGQVLVGTGWDASVAPSRKGDKATSRASEGCGLTAQGDAGHRRLSPSRPRHPPLCLDMWAQTPWKEGSPLIFRTLE